MLIGYVSDEQYVALADVLLEFRSGGGTRAIVRSTPRGAVEADLEPGEYTVTLVKPGYGSKHSTVTVDPARPHHFRLLSDGLLGYVWPRAVQSGERSEFRVHSTEPYRLSLWRYGWRREFIKLLGWFDEHGPRAVMQILPDGDFTQSGVGWNRIGYGSAHHTQFVTGPERSGLYYLHARAEQSGRFFSFPWIVAPAQPQAPSSGLRSCGEGVSANSVTTCPFALNVKALYYDSGDPDAPIDVVAALPIGTEDVSEARVDVLDLPRVPRAVATIHRGHMSRVERGYEALLRWTEQTGERVDGYSREVYLDCDGEPETWVTELQFVLEPKREPEG
jgi:hypothetical protein